MHWFQSVDWADNMIPGGAGEDPGNGRKQMKDRAVYTLCVAAARWGYPQAGDSRKFNVYISLLTLSGHLRTLAALPKERPGCGRPDTR